MLFRETDGELDAVLELDPKPDEVGVVTAPEPVLDVLEPEPDPEPELDEVGVTREPEVLLEDPAPDPEPELVPDVVVADTELDDGDEVSVAVTGHQVVVS